MKLKTVLFTALLLTAIITTSLVMTTIMVSTIGSGVAGLDFGFAPIDGGVTTNGDGDSLPGGGIPI